METLEFYGFDNSNQISFLEKNGFKVYHGSYSVGGLSIASTSRLLEIKGKTSQHGRYYLSGNAFCLEIFKANGYKTIGLFKSPHFFGSYPITWDEYYPEGDVTKIEENLPKEFLKESLDLIFLMIIMNIKNILN